MDTSWVFSSESRSGYLHFSLAVVFHPGSEPEVGDFDAHVVVQEHVTKLEIPVDYLLTVDVPASFYQLSKVNPNFRFRNSLSVHQDMDQ